MTPKKTYVFVHGGGDTGANWAEVAEALRARGHDAVAPDLPCDDPVATWDDYVDAVVADITGRTDLIVVGHSLGGWTAPLVCARVPVERLVLARPRPPTAPRASSSRA